MQGRRAEECQGRESREGKLTIPALAGGEGGEEGEGGEGGEGGGGGEEYCTL